MILVPNEIAWLALNVAKWTPEQAVIAVAVALGESGGDTEAIGRVYGNPNRDLGVWQISTRWQGDKLQQYRWRDPYDNARMARLIFDGFVRMTGDGWDGWTVYKAGKHLDWMADAELAMKFPFEPSPAQAGFRSRLTSLLLRR